MVLFSVAFAFLYFATLASAMLVLPGFEPLPTSPQDFSVIELGLPCPENGEFRKEIALIHWTIEPSSTNEIIVSTNPPGLVDASTLNGVLRFRYNQVSLSTHGDGAGVHVQVPFDQLEQVIGVASTTFVAQVLPGCTSLGSIVMESRQAHLSVFIEDSIVDQFEFIDSGRSNTIYLGGIANLQVTLAGKHSFTLVNGRITTGLVSGNNNVLRVHQGIDELKITGERNRIVISDAELDHCENVQDVARRNWCSSTSVSVAAPDIKMSSDPNHTIPVTCTIPTNSAARDVMTKRHAIFSLHLVATTGAYVFTQLVA